MCISKPIKGLIVLNHVMRGLYLKNYMNYIKQRNNPTYTLKMGNSKLHNASFKFKMFASYRFLIQTMLIINIILYLFI